jgi:hypothetical protein
LSPTKIFWPRISIPRQTEGLLANTADVCTSSNAVNILKEFSAVKSSVLSDQHLGLERIQTWIPLDEWWWDFDEPWGSLTLGQKGQDSSAERIAALFTKCPAAAILSLKPVSDESNFKPGMQLRGLQEFRLRGLYSTLSRPSVKRTRHSLAGQIELTQSVVLPRN